VELVREPDPRKRGLDYPREGVFGYVNPFGSCFEIEFFEKTPSELSVTYRVREEELDGDLLGCTQTYTQLVPPPPEGEPFQP